MNETGKRIETALLKRNDGNQSEMARYIGVTPQAVQKWIAGVSVPRGKNLRKAAEFLGLTESEILFGAPLAAAQRIEPYDANVTPANMGGRPIPVISYIQAGALTEITDPYAPGDGFAVEYVEGDGLSPHAFALEIQGDSMLPEFQPGDRVIIDPEVTPSPGDFVAAKNGHEEATFKKYRPRRMDTNGNMIFELVPLNDDYPILSSETEHLQIIGTMVERRHRRRRPKAPSTGAIEKYRIDKETEDAKQETAGQRNPHHRISK